MPAFGQWADAVTQQAGESPARVPVSVEPPAALRRVADVGEPLARRPVLAPVREQRRRSHSLTPTNRRRSMDASAEPRARSRQAQRRPSVQVAVNPHRGRRKSRWLGTSSSWRAQQFELILSGAAAGDTWSGACGESQHQPLSAGDARPPTAQSPHVAMPTAPSTLVRALFRGVLAVELCFERDIDGMWACGTRRRHLVCCRTTS